MNEQVKEWCKQQCIVQHATTEADFNGMELAWTVADTTHDLHRAIDVKLLRIFAELIDPVANPNGQFRKGPAVFMDGGSSSQPGEIEYRLTNLLEWLSIGLTPKEFYQTLMWIHPWRDGNGRVGALVYNILNGTVHNPVNPPSYK